MWVDRIGNVVDPSWGLSAPAVSRDPAMAHTGVSTATVESGELTHQSAPQAVLREVAPPVPCNGISKWLHDHASEYNVRPAQILAVHVRIQPCPRRKVIHLSQFFDGL